MKSRTLQISNMSDYRKKRNVNHISFFLLHVSQICHQKLSKPKITHYKLLITIFFCYLCIII